MLTSNTYPADTVEAVIVAGFGPWATQAASPAKCATLVRACLVEGQNWATAMEASGIKYNRGWLVVRYAQIMCTNPGLLVALPVGEDAEAAQYHLAEAAIALRGQKLSWGEIAVRTGAPESRVRSAFNAYASMRAEGLRIGKGGRFLAARGDLYQANRQQEGSQIPHVPAKGIVHQPSSVELPVLLNYVPEGGKPARKAASKKATSKLA